MPTEKSVADSFCEASHVVGLAGSQVEEYQIRIEYGFQREHREVVVMATPHRVDVDVPSVIASGSPYDVDQFLVSTLWGPCGDTLPPLVVLGWVRTLRERGEAFASHYSTCHYWLYEHTRHLPALLDAWKAEQHARSAAARSVATLQKQRALFKRLTREGKDTAWVGAVLESMELFCRVYGDVWEMHLAALDRRLQQAEPDEL
ncbi:hypothetical protein [Paraburkholderia caribensis]|uniref:hypothetical protein n=1 Tax=Paraburkholderia caribensis TaxID=75105 RepID=UPI0011DF7D70|nr:hypothetical protein [Paraburkholderia caribensis]